MKNNNQKITPKNKTKKYHIIIISPLIFQLKINSNNIFLKKNKKGQPITLKEQNFFPN